MATKTWDEYEAAGYSYRRHRGSSYSTLGVYVQRRVGHTAVIPHLIDYFQIEHGQPTKEQWLSYKQRCCQIADEHLTAQIQHGIGSTT